MLCLREEEGGMHNEVKWYEQEGGVRIGAPMSNGCSNTNATLDVNYPPMDASNETKMVVTRAPTMLLLPPLPNFNIGLYCLPQAPNSPNLHASPIFDMGDHDYQANFIFRHCHHR